MVKRHIFILFFLLFTPFSVFATVTQVNASVDKNPLIEGEYITLTITANDNIDANALNTSSLKKDFIIGRTSVGKSTQIINFDTKKETRWQILISPKRQGNITIPSFTIDGVKSAPIYLSVVAQGNQTSQVEQAQNLFLKTSLSTKTAYVGQLILYKVKLYIATDLQRGTLNVPAINNADIKQIGEDQDKTEILNGIRYRVIERTYGITPNKAGQLIISGATFEGDILTDPSSIGNMGRGGLFSFNESRPIQTRSVSHAINVEALPIQSQQDSIVSDYVVLQDQWDDSKNFEVGVPITRTVTLLASNAEDNSLPNIHIPIPDGIKVYPEKPRRETIVKNGQLIAKLSQTIAMVPSKSGKITIPEISVPWWNPRQKQQQFATVPKKIIDIKPSTEINSSLHSTPSTKEETLVNNVNSDNKFDFWPWLTCLFLGCWLITLFFLLKEKNNKIIKNASVNKKVSSKDPLSELSQACKDKNASATLKSIQNYFSSQTKKPISLQDISLLSDEIKLLIHDLQETQYSNKEATVDYSKIIQIIKMTKLKNEITSNDHLSPLNH